MDQRNNTFIINLELDLFSCFKSKSVHTIFAHEYKVKIKQINSYKQNNFNIVILHNLITPFLFKNNLMHN